MPRYRSEPKNVLNANGRFSVRFHTKRATCTHLLNSTVARTDNDSSVRDGVCAAVALSPDMLATLLTSITTPFRVARACRRWLVDAPPETFAVRAAAHP